MNSTPQALSVQQRCMLLTGAIIPRPIALVSTLSEQGIYNVAPYSFFTIASFDPMIVALFIVRKKHYSENHEQKDTFTNIMRTGEFVVNISTEPLLHHINAASAVVDSNISEFDLANLTPLPSISVNAPGVKESPIRLECKLEQTMGFGETTERGSDGIFGRVVHIHIDDSVLENSRINEQKLRPLSLIEGMKYGTLGEVITLDRP